MSVAPCSCPGGRYHDYCPRHGHLVRAVPKAPVSASPVPRSEQRSVFEPGEVFHTFTGTVMRMWRCADDGSPQELFDEPRLGDAHFARPGAQGRTWAETWGASKYPGRSGG